MFDVEVFGTVESEQDTDRLTSWMNQFRDESPIDVTADPSLGDLQFVGFVKNGIPTLHCGAELSDFISSRCPQIHEQN